MNTLTKIIASLLFCLSINTTFADTQKEDNSFWKSLDNFLADDDVKPIELSKISSDVNALLKEARIWNKKAKVKEFKMEKGNIGYRINVSKTLYIQGTGKSQTNLSDVSVTFAHRDPQVNHIHYLICSALPNIERSECVNISQELISDAFEKLKEDGNVGEASKQLGNVKFSASMFSQAGILSVTNIK